ncbi:hypothetical protein BVX94_00040, partial [bacterium B17]
MANEHLRVRQLAQLVAIYSNPVKNRDLVVTLLDADYSWLKEAAHLALGAICSIEEERVLAILRDSAYPIDLKICIMEEIDDSIESIRLVLLDIVGNEKHDNDFRSAAFWALFRSGKHATYRKLVELMKQGSLPATFCNPCQIFQEASFSKAELLDIFKQCRSCDDAWSAAAILLARECLDLTADEINKMWNIMQEHNDLDLFKGSLFSLFYQAGNREIQDNLRQRVLTRNKSDRGVSLQLIHSLARADNNYAKDILLKEYHQNDISYDDAYELGALLRQEDIIKHELEDKLIEDFKMKDISSRRSTLAAANACGVVASLQGDALTPRMIRKLHSMCISEDTTARKANIVNVLAETRNEDMLGLYLDLLDDDNSDNEVKSAAISGISKIGTLESADALVERHLLIADNGYLQHSWWGALEKLVELQGAD